jgi:O-succinylbenzoate synthase
MGSRDFMIRQIRDKVKLGFKVLKIKVGALDLRVELELLRWIRAEFGTSALEIRLDANGAWSPEEAVRNLEQFAHFDIHSIEQPIAPGQPAALAKLCEDPLIPVALDEELIGVHDRNAKRELLQQVKPAYVILKPGLLGGFSAAGDWIQWAEEMKIGWWITSALESNIGLNAIAQWTWQLGVSLHQGLGTGSLFSNNVPSPLQMEGEHLWHRSALGWDLSKLSLP